MSTIVKSWHRFDIRRIDDLSNAVLGADLEAVQMAGALVRGSLAFAVRDGIIFSSGLIDGNVMIRGPLSKHAVTLGVGLKFGPGSRVCLNEVTDGDVGVVLPGEECDIFYTAGSLYVAVTLTTERLRREAVRAGLSMDRNLISSTGLHSTPIPLQALTWLREQIVSIHCRRAAAEHIKSGIGSTIIQTVVNHYARLRHTGDGRIHPVGQVKIVDETRKYIRKNLAAPIAVDDLSKAAQTSPRTLFRAFSEILGDTPSSYVRRLRLHRIRKELILNSTTTVSGAAHNWGLSGDLGRFSRNYRNLFGENPSSTLARGRALQRDDTWL